MLNNLPIVEGGPWTWVSRSDPNVKSCLDLVIISRNLLPFIHRLVVDVEQQFTPFRVIKRKDRLVSCYTDHFSLKIIMSGMPSARNIQNVKQTVWNLNKKGGWEAFAKKTNEVAEKVEAIVNDEDNTIEDVMEKVQKVEDKVKFSAFGKTKIKQGHSMGVENKKSTKKCDCNLCDDCEKETKKNSDLLAKQAARIEKNIMRVKESRKGRVGQIFKMKESIGGSKKAPVAPHAIKDPKNNELLVANKDIKRATLEYCADNLRNKKADESVEEFVKARKALVEKKLNEASVDSIDISKNDYEGVLKKFESKPTKSYDFIVKAGNKYQDAIYLFCKRIIEEQSFPIMFRRTLLHMIWKQKGPAEVLKNNRFIHVKEHYLPRTVEALVVEKMKEEILDSSTMYQVGGQPGHSIEEHLFTIKSMIQLLESRGLGMVFTLVDLVSFFDREDIFDVISTLFEVGVNKAAARLWFMLNQNTEIRVKTSAGVTDTALVGDVIGQGTAGAALVSQLNLDHGMKTYFQGSGDEMYYGTVRCEYFAYQDDIGKPNAGVNEAQVANIKMSNLFKEKGLEAHSDKTCYIVFGDIKYKKEIDTRLEPTP